MSRVSVVCMWLRPGGYSGYTVAKKKGANIDLPSQIGLLRLLDMNKTAHKQYEDIFHFLSPWAPQACTGCKSFPP